jgi:hypothetical protein
MVQFRSNKKKIAKLASNLMQILRNIPRNALSAPLQKMMQIRCQKGACTNMHKCSVGIMIKVSLI